jgi:hypothetical protein
MPVAIVGMHRSGTSMVAALLHHAGLYLGPEDELMPASPDNQEGFWENLRFFELDDELLHAAGGGWDEPPVTFKPDNPAVSAVRVKARALAREFEPNRPWGWKDPRTSLLLPFWLDAFPELRIVGCVRNPLEVALSLHRRNYFSYERGLSLWLEYNERLLKTAPPGQLILTHYEAYFADPASELRRVVAHCEIEASDSKLKEACGAASAVLRHNRFTSADLMAAEVSHRVIEAYARLCEGSGWLQQSNCAQLLRGARSRRRKESARGQVNHAVVEAELLGRNGTHLQGEAETRQSALEQLHRRIAELEGGIAAAAARNDTLATEAEAHQASVRELRGELEGVRTQLAEREQQVEQLVGALAAAEAAADKATEQLRVGAKGVSRSLQRSTALV